MSQIQRGLSAELHDYAIALFVFIDMENIFKSQRFKIEFVAGFVVCGDRFRIAVDHDRFISGIPQSEGGMDTAVIEFDSLSDAVRSAAENHDLLFPVRLSAGLVDLAIGGIIVGSVCFKLRGAGIDKAVDRHDADLLSRLVDLHFRRMKKKRDLTVGIAHFLDLAEEGRIGFQIFQRSGTLDLFFEAGEFMHVAQEPFVDHGKFMDAVHTPAALERFADVEETREIRTDQLGFNVFIGIL